MAMAAVHRLAQAPPTVPWRKASQATAGNTSTTITVPVTGDGDLEINETFLVTLSSPSANASISDAIGVGRAVLSYPAMLADAAKNGAMETKFICRTFSDCTTAPRNGLISGCYPLDKYYVAKPEAAQLKEIKKRVGA